MKFEFTLSQCSGPEMLLIWLYFAALLGVIIGLGLMVFNVKPERRNIPLLLTLGAVLIFLPHSMNRHGVIGRRIFLFSITMIIGILYFLSLKDICE